MLVNRRGRRAVIVSAELCMLEERAVLDPAAELLRTQEIVMDTVLLSRTRLACGRGDRQKQRVQLREHMRQQGSLADAGRTGQHKQCALLLFHSTTSDSSSRLSARPAIASGEMAESTTWSLSITRTARVRRP